MRHGTRDARPARLGLTLAVLLASGTGPAVAGDEAAPAPAQALAKAIDGLSKGTDLVLRCHVDTRKAKPKGMDEVVVVAPGVEGGEPFQGEVEIWVTKDGPAVVASRTALPGFEMYLRGDERVVQSRYDARPFSLGPLADDLGSIVDLGRLKTSVEKGEIERSSEGGTDVLRGRLSPRLVRERRTDDAAGFRPEILEVEVEAKLGKDGAIEELAITVGRDDPYVALAEEDAGDMPAGKAAKEEKNRKKEVATRTCYRLLPRAGKAGDRLQRFKADAEALLAGEGR